MSSITLTDALGDLDRDTIRMLDRLARDGRDAIVIPLPELRATKPGTLLVRELEGALHRVMVLEQRFAWKGQTYASKQKGIWMGGVVPLGYRVSERALHVVDEHASLIRAIFAGYLERGAVSALQRQMSDASLHVPERIDGAGRRRGGKPFNRGHLYAILANPIYAGRLAHKDRVHEGQQPAIVDQATWDAVQAKLAANHHRHWRQQASSESLLVGRILDDRGNAMTPSHARRGARRYRYYVSQAVLKGRDPGSITRVPAPEIEALLIGALRSTTPALHRPKPMPS